MADNTEINDSSRRRSQRGYRVALKRPVQLHATRPMGRGPAINSPRFATHFTARPQQRLLSV